MTDAECVEVLTLATKSDGLYQQYRDDVARDIAHALGVPPYLLGVHMTDADALQAVIAEHPADDTPRLVLADWYDNHDRPDDALAQRLDVALRRVLADPDSDAPRLEYAEILRGYECEPRASFIETQVELTALLSPGDPGCDCAGHRGELSRVCRQTAWLNRVNTLRKRERDLWEQHGRGDTVLWGFGVPGRYVVLTPVEGDDFGCGNGDIEGVFRRGFPGSLTASWDNLAAHLDAVLAAAPVTEVTLTTAPGLAPWISREMPREVSCDVAGRTVVVDEKLLTARRQPGQTQTLGGRSVTILILSRRWPQIRTWHLPPEPTPQYAPGRLVVEQPQDGSRIPTVGWEVEPVYGDIHLKSDYSRINPERMLREYRLHLEADSREVGRPTLGMRFGPVTGTLRDSGGRVRVESAVLVDIEPRHNSVILRAAPLAVPTYEPAAWHADPATATPIADLRRFREMLNRMRSHDPTEDSPLQREVERIGQWVASGLITAEEGVAALRQLNTFRNNADLDRGLNDILDSPSYD